MLYYCLFGGYDCWYCRAGNRMYTLCQNPFTIPKPALPLNLPRARFPTFQPPFECSKSKTCLANPNAFDKRRFKTINLILANAGIKQQNAERSDLAYFAHFISSQYNYWQLLPFAIHLLAAITFVVCPVPYWRHRLPSSATARRLNDYFLAPFHEYLPIVRRSKMLV